MSSLPSSPGGLAAAVALVVLGLYLLRRAVLPKPMPGVPYNKESANRFWGDLPLMRAAGSSRREWFATMAIQHNQPLVQLFVRPMSRPWLLLSDFLEAQDIALRRSREFDRSDSTIALFSTIVPDCHINYHSDDPRYKRNKELLRDLMTPAFLHEVSAPQIYNQMGLLVDLWRLKSRLAQDRPFEAYHDIHNYSMDIILRVAFNLDVSRTIMRQHLDHLATADPANQPGGTDDPYEFDLPPKPAELQALVDLSNSFGLIAASPAPRLHHWVLRQFPPLRQKVAAKENLIKTEISKSLRRLVEEGTADRSTRCAMDHMLLREMDLAKKEARRPEFYSRAIFDELLGYLIAGHETTATSLSWGVKRLAQNSASQTRLREALRAAFPAAAEERRQPTIAEISKTTVVYLDAVVEEILRLAKTLPIIFRQAMVDTTVLGVPVKKGTNIAYISHGPGFLHPPVAVDEEKRTESSRHAKSRYGAWEPGTEGLFRPERWLRTVKGDDGAENEVFNANAGPFLSFGSGPRACFGRKLAYLEMRITLVLLLWNFELLHINGELGGMKEEDRLATAPKYCYVKLRQLER